MNDGKLTRQHLEPLQIFNSRAMTTEEAKEILAVPRGGVGHGHVSIKTITATHHSIAQLAAKGLPTVEISLITGRSPSTINALRDDPAFRELLAHYETQKDLVIVDVLGRMHTAGLSAIDELQERLLNSPKSLTARELMELAELGLIKGRVGAGGQAGTGANASAPATGVTINVKFVEPRPAQPDLTIDGKAA